MAIAGGLAWWAAADAGSGTGAVAFIGVAAMLGVAGSVAVGSARVLAAATGGTVAAMAVEVVRHSSGAAALLAGVAIFLQAELAFSALDAGPTATETWEVDSRRWPLVAMVVTVGAALGGLALLPVSTLAGGGLGLEVVGAVTVVALAAWVVVLARRVGRVATGRVRR